MDEVKMDGKTLDITKMNIEALKELFPDVVEEGKIDFEKLRAILGDEIDDDDERYNFTWHGKNQAIRISQTPSMGTLRPCKEKSVDWDNTNNIYIEGDNLEVLKLLQKSYFGKIKMIYIDPPYNREDGKDLIYKDDFSDNITNYLAITGQLSEDGKTISSKFDAEGRLHTNWLNMMYPRIRLCRSLLANDGVIMISIDDDELENLKKICNEIFGGNNELATLIWNKQHSQQQGIFKNYHEYVVVYAKNAAILSNISGGTGIIEAGALKKISKANPASEFTFPAGVRFDAPDGTVYKGTFGDSEKVTVVSGSMIAKDGKLAESVTLSAGWTQKNQMQQFFYGHGDVIDSKGQKVTEFYFNSAGKLKCSKERSFITPSTLLPEFGMSSKHTEELAQLMGGHIFDNPKPVDMIELFLDWFVHENDIVLDFFSGSGTTAHALFKHNIDKKDSCNFILVQLPELCKEDSDAFKLGYKTICDIGEERIRRASLSCNKANIQTTLDGSNSIKADLGFKIFRLDTSNIKLWSGVTKDLQQTLISFEDNLLTDGSRSNLDVLYELIIKLGLSLNTYIDTVHIDNLSIYSIGYGALMVCLDDVSSTAVAEEMIKLYEKEQPEIWKVVFKDNGFSSDSVKANVRETLKAAGLKEDCFLTL